MQSNMDYENRTFVRLDGEIEREKYLYDFNDSNGGQMINNCRAIGWTLDAWAAERQLVR